MKDRISSNPGRIKLTDEQTGVVKYYRLEMADQPSVEGTPLNKGTFLSDEAEDIVFGNHADRTVDRALKELGARRIIPTKNKLYTCFPDLTHPYIETASKTACDLITQNYYIVKIGTNRINCYNRSDRTFYRQISIAVNSNETLSLDESHLYGDAIKISISSDSTEKAVIVDVSDGYVYPEITIGGAVYGVYLTGEDSTYIYLLQTVPDSSSDTELSAQIIRYRKSNHSISQSAVMTNIPSRQITTCVGTRNKVYYFVPKNVGMSYVSIFAGSTLSVINTHSIRGISANLNVTTMVPLWCDLSLSGDSITAVYVALRVEVSGVRSWWLYKITDLDNIDEGPLATSYSLSMPDADRYCYSCHLSNSRIVLYSITPYRVVLIDVDENYAEIVQSDILPDEVNTGVFSSFTNIYRAIRHNIPTLDMIPVGELSGIAFTGETYYRKPYFYPTAKWSEWEPYAIFAVDANTVHMKIRNKSIMMTLQNSDFDDIRYAPGYFREGRILT